MKTKLLTRAAAAMLAAGITLQLAARAATSMPVHELKSIAPRPTTFARAKLKTLLYAVNPNGIYVFGENGTPIKRYATSSSHDFFMEMDDLGNASVAYYKSGPGLVKYALDAKKPSAEYAIVPATTEGAQPVSVSHAGEVVYDDPYANKHGSDSIAFDVWDPGASGKPSRVFKYSGYAGVSSAVGADGTLYLPYYDSATQTIRYDVIAPGNKKPSRTIIDTLVTGSSAGSFSVNWMAVGNDGTLYVEEYGFYQGDPFAGLYVYPPSGPERRVTTGASAPNGLALDSSGDVYVLNNNSTEGSSGSESCDTAHTLSVFSAGASSLLRQTTSGFEDGAVLTVDSAGDAFIDEYPYLWPTPSGCADSQGAGAIALVPAGTTRAQTIVSDFLSYGISLYDGTTATNPSTQAQ